MIPVGQAYLDHLLELLDAILGEVNNFLDPKIDQATARNILDKVMSVTSVVVNEIHRIRSHEELFSDHHMAARFRASLHAKLKCVTTKLSLAQGCGDALRSCLPALDDTFGAPSMSQRPDTSENAGTSPWQKWCRNSKDITPDCGPIINNERAAGHQHVYTQLLPAQGVLIAEHWRLALESLTSGILAVRKFDSTFAAKNKQLTLCRLNPARTRRWNKWSVGLN